MGTRTLHRIVCFLFSLKSESMSKSALAAQSRFMRSSVARGAQSVDRSGGQYGAGLIRQYSVVTRGEALGHDMWIDDIFLAQVAGMLKPVEMADGGTFIPSVKSRFTHPGLSSDGLGKFLGRTTSARVDGDSVRGDLHLAESAHNTPSGDLAGYVMDLAEEDPQAFGASIVFEYDVEAEKDFMAANLDGMESFKSPDPDNVKNLPHARLKRLRASDIVDSPAANPSGLFHSGEDIFEEATAVADFALGIESELSRFDIAFGVHPDRLRSFVRRYLDRRGLEVKATPERSLSAREQCKRYVDSYGDLGGVMFAEGLSFEAAGVKYREWSDATIKQQREKIEQLESQLGHRAEIAANRPTQTAAPESSLMEEITKRLHKQKSGLSPNLTRFAASIRMPGQPR
jgi:hypothetical protein